MSKRKIRKSPALLFVGASVFVVAILTLSILSSFTKHSLPKLDIKGSTSVDPFIKAVKEENLDKYQIKLGAQGSGTGISALFDKTTDIAMSSRDLKPEEMIKAKDQGVNEKIVAKDGIGIIINKNLKISNLTTNQLTMIFTGKITNWSQVGGINLPISVIARDEASGTREGFDKLLGIKNIAKGAKQIEATGEVVRTVAENQGAIGYVSSGSELNGVKFVKVNNVYPTDSNILNESYKLFRNFYLLYYKNNRVSEKFVNFTLTKDMQKLLKSEKYKTNYISVSLK